MHPTLSNIGAYIKASILGLAPAAQAAATRQGPSITVSDFKSAVVAAITGAATGTPTTISVTYSLESSADGTTWTAVNDRDGAALSVVGAAASSAFELDVDLSLLPADHDRIRVKEVVAFTGGTSPTVVTGAAVVVGGAARLPV